MIGLLTWEGLSRGSPLRLGPVLEIERNPPSHLSDIHSLGERSADWTLKADARQRRANFRFARYPSRIVGEHPCNFLRLLQAGWVDFKICSIDETWSGLAFAGRNSKANRAAR